MLLRTIMTENQNLSIQLLEEINLTRKNFSNESIPEDDINSYFENVFTLDLLKEHTINTGESLFETLALTLADRWERIKNTNMAYTEAPYNLINHLCLKIAQIIAPTVHSQAYQLLMPSLEHTQDDMGTDIHQLRFDQFILSDNNTSYIPLEHCVKNASVSLSSKLNHVVNNSTGTKLLSANEIKRLQSHSDSLNDWYLTFDKLATQKTTFYAQLYLVLRQLSEPHSVQDLLECIRNFNFCFGKLTEIEQNNYFKNSNLFGIIRIFYASSEKIKFDISHTKFAIETIFPKNNKEVQQMHETHQTLVEKASSICSLFTTDSYRKHPSRLPSVSSETIQDLYDKTSSVTNNLEQPKHWDLRFIKDGSDTNPVIQHRIKYLGFFDATRRVSVSIDLPYGLALYITGEDEQLGAWKTATRLEYSDQIWSLQINRNLRNKPFKFLIGHYNQVPKIDIANHLEWEQGDNRLLTFNYDLNTEKSDLWPQIFACRSINRVSSNLPLRPSI